MSYPMPPYGHFPFYPTYQELKQELKEEARRFRPKELELAKRTESTQAAGTESDLEAKISRTSSADSTIQKTKRNFSLNYWKC